MPAYLAHVGRPIRYAYVPGRYPAAAYQTVFAREPGSAEMPSAGRPFTTALVTDLVTRGIAVAPITLHTGVSSQDVGRAAAAGAIRRARTRPRGWSTSRARGVAGSWRSARPSRARSSRPPTRTASCASGPAGPTSSSGRIARQRVVAGLITGWHAPGASHLRLLQAVAGAALVERAYDEALRERYLWHEFGDSCLLLP